MPKQIGLFANTESGAVFSSDRVYRYKLWRIWNETPKPRLCHFCMLNPSTADEDVNDPTVTRCEERARRGSYDGLLVTNLFAFRATDPADMMAAADPIGPDNNLAIMASRVKAAITICAWGNDGAFRGRAADVLAQLDSELFDGQRLYCLGVNSTGHPKHPLYVSYQQKPVIYKEAALLFGKVCTNESR